MGTDRDRAVPRDIGRGRRRRLIGPPAVAVAAISAWCLAGAGIALAGPPLTWSDPVEVAHEAPFDAQRGLSWIDCPSTTLCVAGDTAGGILTSTNPTGGAGAWSYAGVDPARNVQGVSCRQPPCA